MKNKNTLCIYTLGPEGTNCAKAAKWWLQKQNIAQESLYPVSNVLLYETLEHALEDLLKQGNGYLLSCAAYPDLHTLIFTRLKKMELCDSFIMPTHSMVFATRFEVTEIKKVAVHPAPQSLVTAVHEKIFAHSNADAAVLCKKGYADACITTSHAAENYGLKIIQDFGIVPMAFLIHSLKGSGNVKK